MSAPSVAHDGQAGADVHNGTRPATAPLPIDADRHPLVLTAQRAAAAGDPAAARDLADTLRWQPVADDVLFQLSAIAVAACWPVAPRGGWRALDDTCTELLDLQVARRVRAS